MGIKSVVLITIEPLDSHQVQVIGSSQTETVQRSYGSLLIDSRFTIHGKAVVRIAVVDTGIQEVVALWIIASVKGFGVRA